MEQLLSAHIERPVRLTYPIQMASFPLPQLRALRGTPHHRLFPRPPPPLNCHSGAQTQTHGDYEPHPPQQSDSGRQVPNPSPSLRWWVIPTVRMSGSQEPLPITAPQLLSWVRPNQLTYQIPRNLSSTSAF